MSNPMIGKNMNKRQERVSLLENCANKWMALGVIMHSSWAAGGSKHCMLGGSEEEGWMGRGLILCRVLKFREV